MKYSISGRQPKELLQKADEIFIEYRDKDVLFDYVELYPDKKIVMFIPKDIDVDWDLLKSFNEKLNLTLEVEQIKYTELVNFHWFWYFPITTYFELDSILTLNTSEVLIDGPLFFDLERVKELCKDVEIRAVPNVAFDAYIPRINGICATYIRPEDVATYEPYIDTLVFKYEDLKEERMLFQIYKEDQKWPGNLYFLIKNLNKHVDNRGFEEDFASTRLNCRQTCCRNHICHFCESYITFINTIDKNKNYLKEQLNDNK